MQSFLRTRSLVIATVPRYATIKALATPEKNVYANSSSILPNVDELRDPISLDVLDISIIDGVCSLYWFYQVD